MALFKQEFDDIKESNNPDKINDFLIKLSENPKEQSLKFLDFFINETEEGIYEKIKLNLVYCIGEIGSLTKIEDFYLQKLIDMYYISDRWVRNEIIQAIVKLSKKSNLNENVILLIGNTLNDDYPPIKINALKVLLNLTQVPDFVFINIFRVLNSKDSAVLEGCGRIFKHLDMYKLFGLLNQLDNYKILKQRAIRSLLIIQFKSIINLESFREMILSSNWIDSYRLNYLKEIDTFQRIIAKNL